VEEWLNPERGVGYAGRAVGATMKKYSFSAIIRPGIGGGAAVIFPYNVEEEFGTKARVPVKSTLDGVPYSGSLVKCGPTSHMLGVLKSIREQIGKGPGDTIDVVIWKDEQERTVELPPEFASLLREQGLLGVFQKLSYTHRKEYCRWITEAKKEETRLKRLAKAVEMLKKGVKTPG
jgi:Bacteriocin-protection, YdeI or OmpD-Associated/Domain of unknown function (DUF1905)